MLGACNHSPSIPPFLQETPNAFTFFATQHLSLAFSSLLLLLSRPTLSHIFGFAYPAYASYKAAKGDDPDLHRQWLMFWCVEICQTTAPHTRVRFLTLADTGTSRRSYLVAVRSSPAHGRNTECSPSRLAPSVFFPRTRSALPPVLYAVALTSAPTARRRRRASLSLRPSLRTVLGSVSHTHDARHTFTHPRTRTRARARARTRPPSPRPLLLHKQDREHPFLGGGDPRGQPPSVAPLLLRGKDALHPLARPPQVQGRQNHLREVP